MTVCNPYLVDKVSPIKNKYKLSNVFIFFGVFIITTIYWTSQYQVKRSPTNNLKYILQWTDSKTEPFVFMGQGQEVFFKRKCPVNNCFITSQRDKLPMVTDYAAILFHGPDMYRKYSPFPIRRSPKQKYVFVSLESSANYPLYHLWFDIIHFNWTWTYKLKSDINYRYIVIKNKHGDVIGPKETMHWLKPDDMKPIDDGIKSKLKNKTKAAIWFVSNCGARRIRVAKRLRAHLAKYNLTLDTYGNCGRKKCSKDKMKQCLSIVQKDYYFYLSFENSISDDYVTEKLLNALQHYAVPVVYGGANYTRFMPEHTYLSIRRLGTKEVARQMADAIQNKEVYYKYFRWHNHYSYHSPKESPDTDSYCQFCKAINDENLMQHITYYHYFRDWWNA